MNEISQVSLSRMGDLFFFDRDFISHLPKSERDRLAPVLRNFAMPQGRPFVLNDLALPDRDLDLVFNELIEPRRRSQNTWRAYARQMHVYLRFINAQSKAWTDANQEDLKVYRKVRMTGESQSGPPIKGKSWNQAATAIVLLYETAMDHGLIEVVPFKYRRSKAVYPYAPGTEVETADLKVKVTPEPINFISIGTYKSTWRPHVAHKRNSQRNIALTEFLLATGVRISEALNLELQNIPDPDAEAYAGRKSVTIRVVGKGNKARQVRVPKSVIRAIRWYIEEEREEVVRKIHARQRKQNKKLKNISAKVFLSVSGNRLSARAVQTHFKSVSIATGVNLKPHGCRHTFAVHQLDAMIKKMAANLKEIKARGSDAYRQVLNDPLRQLQLMLGHASITSTYIYLDFLEEAEAQVDESLAEWTDWVNENGR